VKTSLPLLSAIILLTTSACATTHPALPPSPPEISFQGLSPEAKQAIKDIEQQILEANTEIEVDDDSAGISAPPRHTSRIPLEINERVMKWIRYFTIQDRDRFERFLRRGSVYKNLVESTLKECGVPRELYYLAMIESGYAIHARSRARAVGVWQFMRGTGLRYGLKQNRDVDERKDVIRATRAAARYLKNLHTAFQSWYLAIASYNAGEGRILGAIMRGGTRDFWELVEKKSLPPETRNYVPKFLAGVIIGQHPEKYGFTDIDAQPFPEVQAVSVAGGISLSNIATHSGVSLALLRRLNPHLSHSRTPRAYRHYDVWIPKDTSQSLDQIQLALAKLRPARHAPRRTLASHASNGRVRRVYHRVARGENLTMIARRYHLSVSALKKINGLRGNRLVAGKRLVVSQGIIHRVRSGEALTVIAAHYKVPLRRIKRMNDLKSNRIYAGQRLVIAAGF